MESAYLSALAALAGSVIGGFTSFATSWLVQQNQTRNSQRFQEIAKRETLYGSFIDEAAKRYAEALERDSGATSDFVLLYAQISRMELFASSEVLNQARQIMELVLSTYISPAQTLSQLKGAHDADVLRGFSDACRKDLGAL